MWLLACAPPEPAAPPRVGITGSTELLAAAVTGAGGVPVPLDTPEIAGLDALILGPGADVDPSLYGELPDPTTRVLAPGRQDLDFAALRAADAADLPILGVCLGAQEIGVLGGATLVQDLPTELGVDHRTDHAVRVEPGTPFEAWYPVSPRVASRHHQAVADPPFPVGARAGQVVEGFWAPDRRFLVGVQWHPEVDPDVHQGLWRAFLAAASEPGEPRPPGPEVPAALPRCETVHAPLGDDRRSLASFRKRVGSRFGDHRDSFVAGHRHGGLDLKTAFAEEVRAICAGRVVDIHLAFPHTTVVVEHHLDDGRVVYSSYKHVIPSVSVGDRVTEATRIGRVFDAAEQRRAPWGINHLHFEMRSSIADAGAASWTSMSMDDLERYAFDPLPFFEERLAR